MFHGDYGEDKGLSDIGKQKVDDVAKQMVATGSVPDVIVHSPVKRTTETACRLKEAFHKATGRDIPMVPEEWLDEAHCPTPDNVKHFNNAANSVLMVTHSPNIARLLLSINREEQIYNSVIPGYASAYELDSHTEDWGSFEDTHIQRIYRPNTEPAYFAEPSVA